MAQYDWEQLKKDYILGEYKSLKEFAETKNIKYGYLRQRAKGWDENKRTKNEQKTNKIIEKTIEKVSDKESNRIARILSISDKLVDKIEQATEQLEQYIITNKVKTKTIEYGKNGLKPTKEVITEEEVKEIVDGIIDKQGIKSLTAALKDIKDINTDKQIFEVNSKNDNIVHIKLEGDLQEWAK